MLTEPKLTEVVTGSRGMLPGIDACLQTECLVSAVTLMFSAIDALAALARPVGQRATRGGDFRAWTERFLHPQERLRCTSLDLWGARCGVLHTYSPESTMAADAGARRIYYQWREGPAVGSRRQLLAGSLVVVVEDLHGALVDAADTYMAATATDPDLRERLEAHLPSLLCYEPFPNLAATV